MIAVVAGLAGVSIAGILAVGALVVASALAPRPDPSIQQSTEPPAEPTYSDIRIRFVKADIAPPADWDERWRQGTEFPDPCLLVFLNGKAVFVLPEEALINDTYQPEWNVLMSDYMRYDFAARDELTVLIVDNDADMLGAATKMFSNARVEVGVASGFVGVEGVSEQEFNKADRIARWSGKIPEELLKTGQDESWSIAEGRLRSLEMLIEKRH